MERPMMPSSFIVEYMPPALVLLLDYGSLQGWRTHGIASPISKAHQLAALLNGMMAFASLGGKVRNVRVSFRGVAIAFLNCCAKGFKFMASIA